MSVCTPYLGVDLVRTRCSDNPGVLEGPRIILADFLAPIVPDIVVPPIDTSDLEVPTLPARNLGSYGERVRNKFGL